MIGYTTDSRRRVVFVRAWGTVTERQMIELARALERDATINPDWSCLIDARDAGEISVGGSFLRGYRSAFSRTSLRAVLASRPVVVGLSRMYALSQGLDDTFLVCHELPEALAWLGLPQSTRLPDHVDDLNGGEAATG